MSSPPASHSGGGSRRTRYSRSPSSGGVPPSKRSKPSSSMDAGNGSDQHRVYTSICVKNINPKIPDLEVRELCDKKFSKYGPNSVKIFYKNQERVAFVNFTNSDDARKARHAKTGLVWENLQIFLEPVYYRRTVPAEQPLNPGSPSSRSPPSPKRRPRRPPSPSPPPVSSRNRHRRTPTPPRPRRHYSPYIPLPPDLVDYAGAKSGRNRQDSSPSPSRNTRGRSRSTSASPIAYKNRGRTDDQAASRTESNVQHEPTRTLFVGNLERDIRESKLKEVFGRYGTIEEIDLKVPQSSSKRAYAFIQYENMDMAYEARRAMDGHFIGKADCKIGYGKIVPTNCLWMGNIPIDMKRRDLEQTLARYGAIKSFDYANGDPIAIVTFNEIEDAIKARGKMTGVTRIADGRKERAESGQSDLTRRAGIRMDYLDRPTARRFVIVRPQDKPSKRRTSRSSSVSSVESTRSSKGRARSISPDDVQEKKISKRQSSSPATPPAPAPPAPPAPSKRRSPSPPSIGRTFYGPFGSYFSTDDAANVTNIDELINFCQKLSSTSTTKTSSVYPVQFNLKSHAYDARMHFMAGSPQLANDVLRQYLDAKHSSTELKITQRHHLDQQKMEDMEKKLRTSVSNASTRSNTNGQSSSTLANETNFAVLITSPTARKSNGRSNSPNHQFSSDENEDRSRTNADDESSLSNLISYLAGKEAAGLITLSFDNDREKASIYIFPPCQFSKKFLRTVCPSMNFSNGPRTPPSRPSTTNEDEHLMVVLIHSD